MKTSTELKDQAALRALLESSHLHFCRYFSRFRWGLKFRVNWHHKLIADVIDDVIQGRRKNVAISVSPGSSKTELVVINLIARGLALNPRARFLHLSGSDSLASLNSATAREIVTSDPFQELWPLKIADDAKAKKRWNVVVNGLPAGGVYATSIGGQVTGFRAGHMADGFQGAIIIDDPIKPEEAFSRTKLDAANRKLITTVKSRKANPDTPIILVMQRIAENDCIGFIEKGNLGKDWTFIRIPAVLDDHAVEGISEKYRKAICREPRSADGRFSYWPYKEPIEQLLEMERGEGSDASGQKISRFVFSSQWMQAPKALGGNIIHGKDFKFYRVAPKLKYRKIFADTAQKTKERNDFSSLQEWGYGVDGRIYFLAHEHGKWEAPELQRRLISFWARAKARDVEQFGHLREAKIEDKSSGTGLIQTVKLPPHNIPVKAIERDKDKLTRVMDGLPYIESGQVCVPEDAPWTASFISECESFTADDTHDHDDQVDACMDAIEDMLSSNNRLKVWEHTGRETANESAPKSVPPSVPLQILQRYRTGKPNV